MGKRTKTRASLNRLRRAGFTALIIMAVSVVVWWLLQPADPVASLQQRSHNMPLLALANSALKPPTNKWFSSLAFKQPSDPVFAYPLAFQTTANGFAI